MNGRRKQSLIEEDLATRLAETLQDALDLLQAAEFSADGERSESIEKGNLLDQCLALCEQQVGQGPEPIRTVHQFACTGGTLLCKCIAAMPNVQLLSEVDPISMHTFDPAAPRFAPTDMVRQLRQSTRGTNEALLIELFQQEMRLVHAHASESGLRLVVRDHAHSHFCLGSDIPERPTLRELLPSGLPVLPLLIVRHPLDSFASLVDNKWLHFSPSTYDEYCRRYLAFLDRYTDVPHVRFEDFVSEPDVTMTRVCDILLLPYNESFQMLFAAFKITGDSGRSAQQIGPRSRRGTASRFIDDSRRSPHHAQLADRLGYDIVPE